MRRHEPPIRTLPLPEVREMVATALRYINGEIHYSYLVGPTSDCRFWAKVYRLHPAIQQLASDWSLWVDQVWNEWKQHPVSLPESELRRRIAADLGLDCPPVASRIASTSPMNASSRIVEVFDRLVALGRDALPSRPLAEQFVYYIVATRCDIEINGFDSVFEQHLNPAELEALVNGLRRIDEPHLAVQFWRGFQLLESEGF